MTAIIYTYPPDYFMAGISARILAERGVKVILAIDSADPPVVCEFAETVRTRFDRQKNLNGRAFIVGHLQLMHDHASGDYAIKIDSDTLMIDPSRFVAGRDELALGIYEPHMNGMQGCCYALRVDALPAMLDAAKQLPDQYRYMEDKTIGQIASKLGRVHLPIWRQDPNLYSFYGNNKPLDWYRENAAVVHFEPTEEFPRRAVALAMKSFLL
jgi:hypothetical protein